MVVSVWLVAILSCRNYSGKARVFYEKLEKVHLVIIQDNKMKQIAKMFRYSGATNNDIFSPLYFH